MGLDASVMCTCFAEGKAAALPLGLPVEMDEHGFLRLAQPCNGNEENYKRFDLWMETACPHPMMNLASDLISWPGLRIFQQTLVSAGAQHFPALLRELPAGNNSSSTAAASAAVMLQELEFFSGDADLGLRTSLVNTATGGEIYESISAYEGTQVIAPDGLAIGIDDDGFFVRQTVDGIAKVLFRSVTFEQVVVATDENGRPRLVEYVDIVSGQRFRSDLVIADRDPRGPDGRLVNDKGRPRFEPVLRLHATTRKQAAVDFDYILAPLQKLCSASSATGNPLRWE